MCTISIGTLQVNGYVMLVVANEKKNISATVLLGSCQSRTMIPNAPQTTLKLRKKSHSHLPVHAIHH